MSNRSSIALRSGALLAAGLLGAVVAYTVADARASGSPTPSASSSAAAKAGGGNGNGGKAKKAASGPIARIGARTVHGEFVTGGGTNGTTTVTLLQRGTLTAASAASISVRSTDGFTATYPVGAQTTIRKDGSKLAADTLATGDNVVVLATRTGSTVTTTSITVRTDQTGAAGNGNGQGKKKRQQKNQPSPSPAA